MSDLFKVHNGFIEPAKAKSDLWRIPLTLLIFVAFYVIFTLLVMGIGMALVSPADQMQVISGPNFSTPPLMVLIMSSFAGMTGGLVLAMLIVHRRGLKSLLGVRANFIKGFAIAALCVWGMFGLSITFTSMPDGVVENLPFDQWIRWLPLALVLLLIQVSAEEFVFRGYIQQQLAAKFSSPWVWMVIPSVIFGCLHFNPSELGSNAWLAVVQTSLIALIMADLTMRTGNLGAAIGLHFANNVIGILYTSLGDSLSGFARYVLPISADRAEELRPLLMMEVGSTAVVLVIYFCVVTRWLR